MERGFVQTFIDYMSLLIPAKGEAYVRLLYTSDAAYERLCVDRVGCRMVKTQKRLEG